MIRNTKTKGEDIIMIYRNQRIRHDYGIRKPKDNYNNAFSQKGIGKKKNISVNAITYHKSNMLVDR